MTQGGGLPAVAASTFTTTSSTGAPARQVSAASGPAPGARIGQYELIRELGRGGMGTVYLARDLKLGRRVAIKMLQGGDTELNTRFLLEARTTARCNHENIVVIHEVGEEHDRPFMVLEYLQGSPLSKLLADGRALAPARAVELMVPVVRALERAHQHNIVHRDLKPDNIFLTDTGTVKVLDFGIAKLVQDGGIVPGGAPGKLPALAELDALGELSTGGAALTQQGALVGTLPYMSPEQWGAGTVDHRTDIWAVGIILFQMVAGKHPLAPASGRGLMITGVLSQPMPSVRQACPELPDELAALIDRCLAKPKEQRFATARELLDALEPHLPGRYVRRLDADESPYAGLSAFQESDAARFFGRTREIAAAVARLQSQPLVAVIGPSGVGKSSFIRAGLVPALKHSGEPWMTLVVRPGREPVGALAQLIAPLIGQSATTANGTVHRELDEQRSVHQRLYDEPGYLGSVLRSRARRRNQRILIFVDQLEELYTLTADANERLAFTACLASVADDATAPLRVVLSVRSDFLDRVAEDPGFLSELMNGLFFLSPPSREGMQDALIQPAEMAGYRFESQSMVTEMLDHLEQTPGALPLLQFAATKLWDMRDRKLRLLSESSYRALGGIAGALASHADAVMAKLPAQMQVLARAVFLRLVTPERTRAIVSVAELGELSRDPYEVQRLIEHLVNARLVVVQTGETDGAASISIEIVHESLIHSWPLLRRWLDENQDDAGFIEELRSAARQWHTRGRPAGLLWRGEAMEEARRWHRRYRGELPEVQQAYLQAVFTLAARATRRKRLVVASVMVVLALVATAAAVGLVVIRGAEQKAAEQAEMARKAELATREQLVRTQAEERARREAEESLRATLGERDKLVNALTDSQTDIEERNALLSKALRRAKRAKRKAEEAERIAQAEAEAKRRALHKAELAWEEMKARLLHEIAGLNNELKLNKPKRIETLTR